MSVAQQVIQGAAASSYHSLTNSGNLSIPETPEIAALRAQLDLEDQQIALQHQQELQAIQQSQTTSQQAMEAIRQQREQARQQRLLAHQQQCQQARAVATPSQPIPISGSPHTAFNFGNFSAPAHATHARPAHHASTGSLPNANPNINVQPASPLAGMDHAAILALIDQRSAAQFDQRINSHNYLNPAAANLHSCTMGGSAPNLVGERGKPLAHSIENSEQAARLGIHVSPVFEVQGDLVGVDMTKLRKIMTPGADQVGAGLVFRQIRWPHKMLQPEVPGFDVTAHKDLTFHQFINGMLSKLVTETPADRLDKALANKIAFTQFLVAMSFHYTHKQVLDTCHEMMMSWMMKEFEWTDWTVIEARLKGIRARFQHVPQYHTFTNRREPNHNGGGQPKPPAPQGKQDINGVPKDFMRNNQICMNFNDAGCKEKGSHENRFKAGQTLKHICGGCYKKDNSEQAHAASSCGKGPFKSLFR